MGYAICLTLDAASAAAVRSLWQRLAADGICDHMLALDYAPHLSLAVLDGEPPRELVQSAFAALNGSKMVPVKLGGVRTFADTSIAWLAVDGGTVLAELHAKLLSMLPLDEVRSHYRPGQWTPHVTLQMTGDVKSGMALADTTWPEARGARFEGVELVQFPPVVVLNRLALR